LEKERKFRIFVGEIVEPNCTMNIIDKLHKLADSAFDYTQGDYCNVIMSEKALVELNDYFLNLKQGPKPKSNTLTDVKIHLHGILCSISTYDEVLFFEMKDNMKLNSATEEIFIFTESKEKLQQKEFNVHQVSFRCIFI